MRKTRFVAILTVFFTLFCDLNTTGDEFQVVNEKIARDESLIKINEQQKNSNVFLNKEVCRKLKNSENYR